MTILFVAHYSGFYGANKSLLTLILHLKEKYGIKPIVLLPTTGPICKELEQAWIPYIVKHYYWWVNENHGIFQCLLNKRKQIKNLIRINKIAEEVRTICRAAYNSERIDLVYTNSVCINIGIFISERLKAPHIWQFRESLSQFNLSLSLSLSLSLWHKSVNKRYILISDYMMDFYSRYLPQDRMVRIYNGVSLPKEISNEKKITTPKDTFHICTVGVLCDQKNQIDAVRAIDILYHEGIDIHLHLYGPEKSDYRQMLNNFVKEHDIAHLIHFEGHTDNVFDRIKESNLAIMSSRDEAFGRVTIEYMLMGLPVIAANSGANEELVQDSQTGFIYEIGNFKQLAEHIKYYILNPGTLHTHGKTARKYAEEFFSAERNADLIYEQIIDVVSKNES